jgi:hypothetical protein
MPRVDIARFTSGALIALLMSSLALTGVGLYWVLPKYSQDVAHQLHDQESGVSLKESESATAPTADTLSEPEVLVPAATIIGHSAVAQDTQAGSQYIHDKQNIIEVRVPSDWIVEYLSDGFLLKAASTPQQQNEIQVVIGDAVAGEAASVLAGISGVPEEQIAQVDGQSTGFLAQARRGSQALFKNGDRQVLLTATTSDGDFLMQFQAIIRTLRFL